MTDWFRDEAFWSELYPFLFSEERIEAAETEVERLLELVDFDGETVLDLGCGPGRHAVELARRGYDVTGVDLSEFLLDKARSRAEAEGVEVEWIRADMREFVRAETFDIVVSLFHSLGYFEDPEDDLRVFRNCHRSLKPGGILVLDMAGKEVVAQGYEATSFHDLEDGSVLVERHEVVDDWNRIDNRWFLIRGDEARTFRFRVTLYSGRELKDRLARAGFSTIRLYGDLGGGDYDLEAERLVAAAGR